MGQRDTRCDEVGASHGGPPSHALAVVGTAAWHRFCSPIITSACALLYAARACR